MPRSGRIARRKKEKDALYGSVLVQNFINIVMSKGKKSKAEMIVYGSLEEAGKKLKKEPVEIFETVMKNVSPLMEVKSRRVGGATYQVPIEVPRARGEGLAMRWIKDSASKRPGRSMVEKLSQELVEAFSNGGGAIKERENMHKTAESNKAFAHFRW